MELRELLAKHKMECNRGVFESSVEIILNNGKCIRIAYDDFLDCLDFLKDEILEMCVEETEIKQFQTEDFTEVVYRVFLE